MATFLDAGGCNADNWVSVKCLHDYDTDTLMMLIGGPGVQARDVCTNRIGCGRLGVIDEGATQLPKLVVH